MVSNQSVGTVFKKLKAADTRSLAHRSFEQGVLVFWMIRQQITFILSDCHSQGSWTTSEAKWCPEDDEYHMGQKCAWDVLQPLPLPLQSVWIKMLYLSIPFLFNLRDPTRLMCGGQLKRVEHSEDKFNLLRFKYGCFSLGANVPGSCPTLPLPWDLPLPYGVWHTSSSSAAKTIWELFLMFLWFESADQFSKTIKNKLE